MKYSAIIFILAITWQQSLGCPGCPKEQDFQDSHLLGYLDRVLASQNSNEKVTKVLKATSQVVSGIKYNIEFETENSQTKEKKVCESEFLVQAWISDHPQILSYSCKQSQSLDLISFGVQPCFGCPVIHDPKTYDVTGTLTQVMATQNSEEQIFKVLSVTTQVVSGTKYSVKFESLNPKTNLKKICETEYISKPWISKIPEVMSYKCQPTSLEFVALKPSCDGCSERVDPKNFDLTSLNKVVAMQNGDDKVVKVLSVIKQVVAGLKYVVEFESANPTSNEKKICKTTYIVAPWISKQPQVQSYQCQPSFATEFIKAKFPADKFEVKILQSVMEQVNAQSDSTIQKGFQSIYNIESVPAGSDGIEYYLEFTINDTRCLKNLKHANCLLSQNQHTVEQCFASVLTNRSKDLIKILELECAPQIIF